MRETNISVTTLPPDINKVIFFIIQIRGNCCRYARYCLLKLSDENVKLHRSIQRPSVLKAFLMIMSNVHYSLNSYYYI